MFHTAKESFPPDFGPGFDSISPANINSMLQIIISMKLHRSISIIKNIASLDLEKRAIISKVTYTEPVIC